MIMKNKNKIHYKSFLKHSRGKLFFKKYNVTIEDADFQSVIKTMKSSRFILSLKILLIVLIAFTASFFTYRFIPSINVEKDLSKNQIMHIFFHIDSLEVAVNNHDKYIEGMKDVFKGNLSPDSISMLDSVAVFQSDSLLAPGKIEQMFMDNYIAQGQEQFVNPGTVQLNMYCPIHGTIVKRFDTKKKIQGMSFKAEPSSYLVSPQYGWVAFAESTSANGNVIVINHTNGYTSIFRNCGSLIVKQGEMVNAGEAISLMPSSSKVPNLYYELWFEGETVNPEKYIEFY